MKSIRILSFILVLSIALIPAVLLRSGNAVADADPPTKEQIINYCAEQVFNFALTVAAAMQNGVKLEDLLGTNPKLPKPLVDLAKAIYANKPDLTNEVNASMVDCINLYTKKTVRRT